MTDGRRAPYRVGRWLPSDEAFLQDWLGEMLRRTLAEPCPLRSSVAALRDLIECDARIGILFHQMFEQVPHRRPFDRDPAGHRQVRSCEQMLQLLNTVLTQAPEYDETGLVGCPINAILDWSMGTAAGMAAFLDPAVNAILKRILNEWARFLRSPQSTYVLNEHPRKGWFGAAARRAMPNFAQEFVCDPKAPHHGFESWDHFFTRRHRPGVRPVASPDDPSVIVNACESAPYRLAREVKLRDSFWIKAQPYSLVHMLGGDPRSALFAGGSVYQAYLSPLSYHRWHSPVSGRVVRTAVIDGTYYAEAATHGFDPAAPNDSQAYITGLATRAIILIEADNPAIGLMCFLGVGMAEVSSCDITVYEGQQVRKGDPLGMFHYGGSTHCLIFRPEVHLRFDLHGLEPGLHAADIPVNARIATVLGH